MRENKCDLRLDCKIKEVINELIAQCRDFCIPRVPWIHNQKSLPLSF